MRHGTCEQCGGPHTCVDVTNRLGFAVQGPNGGWCAACRENDIWVRTTALCTACFVDHFPTEQSRREEWNRTSLIPTPTGKLFMADWLGTWGLIYTHDPNGFVPIKVDPTVLGLITALGDAPPPPPPTPRRIPLNAPRVRERIVLLPGEIPCGCNNCRMA